MTLSENQQTERSSFSAPAECRFRQRLAAVLVAQALLTMSASAPAAVLPADCASLGGTVGEGGVCSISGLKLSSINDSWDIASEQTVVISGSDTSAASYGISVGADNGGIFQINVEDQASLTIRGGRNSSHGISAGAKDGTLQLVNAGSLLIKGGASNAYGIANGARGGTFILSNGSTGLVRIEGSDSSSEHGMLSGVTDGLFTLSNTAGGRIEISGGGAESAPGIGSLAIGETAKAVVENDGCILWQGSANGANGMSSFSYDGAETVVTNGSRGELVIKGSDTSDALGVFYWADGAGSRVSIDNSGILSILGGAGSKGVQTAVSRGGSATVVNRGGAEMTIAGGSASYASGIGIFSARWGSEGTSTAEIINEAGAVLNISGGTAAGACGITYGADSGSGRASFSLLNQEDALLKLTGNTAQAIYSLNDSANSSASIINSGTAVLNANAIYKFGEANADGTKNFTNKAAGTLRAEVGALFSGATVTKTEQTKTITVSMMTADGVKTSESRELTGYDYSVTGSAISMKSDWLNLAEFEEGSTVVFTDVPEGSEAAETIQTKFADAHGSGVNLAFTKPFAERGIDLASAQAMVDAHPGVVFYDSDIAVAGDIFKITGTTGFRSISGATGVTVTDGGKLTLIGDSRTASDSPLYVKEGGSLQLGTLVGDLGQSGGSLRSISNAGALTVLGGFEAKTLRNTGTASSDYGAIMELTGRGTEASDIGSYVNRGILRVSGEAKSGRVTQEYGRFEVTAGASAHLDTLEGNGIVENKGTLVAEGGTLTGTVVSEGLTSIEHYRGGLGSSFKTSNGGVVMAESFNSLGVVRASGGTLVIGTASKERYLLDHLDEARQIVEAGGSVSDAVLEALEAAGETQAVSTWRLRRATLTSDADMVTEDTIALLEDGIPVIPDEETVPVMGREPQIVLNKAVIQRESFAGAMTFAAHTIASEEASAAETLALNGRRGLSAELVGVTAKRGGYRAERTGVRIGMIGTDENVSFGWTGSVTNGDVKFEGSRSAQTISGTVFAGLKRHDVVLTGYAGAGFGRVRDGDDRPEYKSMMLGLQGGIPIQWEAWEILPHAGFRTVRLETDGADNATVKEVPVGLSVRGRFTIGDQAYLPAFDLTHVRTFGDRSVRTETQDAVIESAFTGKHRTELKLGVSAWTGRWRTELDCAGAFGDGGTRSASIGLRGTMSF